MGTTFSACVSDKNRLFIAHIGDSRIYAAYKDKLKLITSDHSFVFEMQKLGQITEEEARNHPKRNMLTRVLGVERDANIDGLVYDLTGCDKILMCTDGLTNMLTDDEIFAEMSGENETIAARLTDMANTNGGADNITLILFDAGGVTE